MKQTQTSSIKDYLLDGNSLTSIEAFEKFGCTRLSARIFDMRKAGIQIKTEMVEGRNRYGSYCRYACYYIK
jgi:hypothetical protein